MPSVPPPTTRKLTRLGLRLLIPQRPRPVTAALVLAILLALLPFVGRFGVGGSGGEQAAAAGDPVIAAAGDIACDPSNANFNAGNGKSGACMQKATYNLLLSINPVAVLALGDTQ